MQKIFFFAALLLPALLFSQSPTDSIDPRPVITLGSSGRITQLYMAEVALDSGSAKPSASLTWGVSASCVIVDSATAAQNRLAMYRQQKVKRDTAMPIIISRDSIRQDNKIVGYFVFSSGTSSVYSPGGILIASATNMDDQHWRIRTFPDAANRQLFAKGFFEQDIAEYLIKQGYL